MSGDEETFFVSPRAIVDAMRRLGIPDETTKIWAARIREGRFTVEEWSRLFPEEQEKVLRLLPPGVPPFRT